MVKARLLSSSLPMPNTKDLLSRPESPGEIIVHNEGSITSNHNDGRITPPNMTDVPLSSSSSSPSSPLSPGRVMSPSEHNAAIIEHYSNVSSKYKDLKVDDIQARRYRTAFTKEQISRLEKEFSRENYLSRPKRCELAADLQLPESTIKVWFQNRRMKDKRQRMAVTWPFGVPDPNMFAFFAAMSSYPYNLPSAHAQLGYHALGLPRVPTPTMATPMQPRTDLLHTIPTSLTRSLSLEAAAAAAAQSVSVSGHHPHSHTLSSLHPGLGCGLSFQSHNYASQLMGAQNLGLCPGSTPGKPCNCAHSLSERLHPGLITPNFGLSHMLNNSSSHSVASIQNQS